MPVAPFLIKKNEVKAVQIRTKSEKQNQRFENRKSPENRMVPGFLSLFGCKIASDQRLLN